MSSKGFVAQKISKGYSPALLPSIAKRRLAKILGPKLPCIDDHWRPNPGPQEQFFNSPCQEILYGGAAGGGKLLRMDEPIPTPSGWTTMGELRPGDFVFGADGRPTRVVWCSDVERDPDAWELEFDDGTKIQCDAGHQWVTLTDAERQAQLRLTAEFRERRRASRQSRIGGKKSAAFSASIAARNSASAKPKVEPPPQRGTTRTTREIIETLRVGKAGRANHCILNPAPVDLPDAQLPVEPYTLGAWLGDGTSASSNITGIDPEVWESIVADGYEVVHLKDGLTHRVTGLITELKKLGVAGNKHIPQEYLRGSTAQRTALLQGLCDTDGHATTKGSIEFTTTSEALKDGVCELLATLGIKASCREGRATLKGRDISAKWRIQFWTEAPCFRIQRKLDRQKQSGFRGTHDRRYIVEAHRVPPSPMRCIGVEAESKTYLAGRAMVVTHNSDALIAFGLKYSHLANCNAILFRRDATQFDDLIAKSTTLYPKVYPGISPVYSPHFRWKFPSGAVLNFRHMQHEKDASKYDGWEINVLLFDELTHFLEKQYLALMARVRSANPELPTLIRATTNPGGPGHEWVFRRWGAWMDPEFEAIGLETRRDEEGNKLPPALPGEVWWIRTNRDGKDEYSREKPAAEKGVAPALSRTFIPASVDDCPQIRDNDPNYVARLDGLDAVRRAQLKYGDWLAKPGAGKYFQRSWVELVDRASVPRMLKICRAWDLAGTEKKESKSDPDWTVGGLFGLGEDERLYVLDIVKTQSTPGKVIALVKQTAEIDGPEIPILFPQDPGQAGKSQVHNFRRELIGYIVKSKPVAGDKLTRFGPFSSYAEGRLVSVVKGHWTLDYFAELEAFPEGAHDDQVDATSDGFGFVSRFNRLVRAMG